MHVLITGANGFIGRAIYENLFNDYAVTGIDIKKCEHEKSIIKCEKADLTKFNSILNLFTKYRFDTIIHCAGIAHQKIRSTDSITYMRVNSHATENLAKAASNHNPSVCFIFLSSVSVYGEQNFREIRREEDGCLPSSDYARSKLDGEKRLIKLYESGVLKNLIILRLAPVYDLEWSFNLERRIMAPKKIAYLKFGKGQQRMSTLARKNLVEFIRYLIQKKKKPGIEIMNVCDLESYEFNEIIGVFKNSNIYPIRPTIPIPLPLIWLATRFGGVFNIKKKDWVYSCYDKLASNLIFDNTKMLATGFRPGYTLQTIFVHK